MVRFIVDSTFGLTREFALENGVKVVNLTLVLDGKEYPEGYSGEWDEFYNAYAASKSAAKTSQPSPKMFMNAIEEIYAEDKDSDIVILTIGDRLSGTVSSAQIAALQYPDRNIAVIDSHNAATSAFLMLRELLDAAKAGADFESIKALTEDLKTRTFILFIPARLTELARGGRVNKLVSTIGNILNIKPVFKFGRNEVNIPFKALGLNRAVKQAMTIVPKKFDRISACYIYDGSKIDLIKDRLKVEFGVEDAEVNAVSPVLGAHIGLGTIGVAVIASKEE